MNDLALRVLLVEDTPSEADLTRFYLSRISSTAASHGERSEGW